jgi:hypothetical protein
VHRLAHAQGASLGWTGGLSPEADEILPPGATEPATLRFGTAIATEANVAMVSMPSAGVEEGKVALFLQPAPGVWERQGSLQATPSIENDAFGEAIQLSGDTAVIAASRHLYVFKGHDATWTQTHRHALAEGQWFTGAISLSGESLAAGVMDDDGNGSVLVLRVTRQGTLAGTVRLTAFDVSPFDGFGQSVSLWQDQLIVGASARGDGAGAAYVFRRLGSRWTQAQKLTAFDGTTRGSFGTSVATRGNVVIVGAPDANATGGIFGGGEDFIAQGAAYVFVQQGRTLQAWQKLRPTPAQSPYYYDFGRNVQMHGTRLAIAGSWPVSRFESGSVFLYQLTGRQYLLRGSFEGSPSLGVGLALTEDVLIAGIPWDPMYSIGFATLHEFGLQTE